MGGVSNMEYIRDSSAFARGLLKYVLTYFRISEDVIKPFREDLYQEIDVELYTEGVYGKNLLATKETIYKIIRSVRRALYRVLRAHGYIVRDNKYYYPVEARWEDVS